MADMQPGAGKPSRRWRFLLRVAFQDPRIRYWGYQPNLANSALAISMLPQQRHDPCLLGLCLGRAGAAAARRKLGEAERG